MWWFVVVWHVGADVLVDGDVPKGLVLFLSSLEPFVTIGSVVWLNVFCESGVHGVNPCGTFGLWVLVVVVAGRVSMNVEREAPVFVSA